MAEEAGKWRRAGTAGMGRQGGVLVPSPPAPNFCLCPTCHPASTYYLSSALPILNFSLIRHGFGVEMVRGWAWWEESGGGGVKRRTYAFRPSLPA